MPRLPTEWPSHGAYDPRQAAMLLGVSTAMVKRWVYGYGKLSPAIIAEYPDHPAGLLTFLDLVQCMAIRAIRGQRRVSLQKIRATVKAAHRLGVTFPFARRHKAYVFHDDVVLQLDDGELLQVTGRYSGHRLLRPVVYEYLEDLGFDDQGLANEYKPLRRAHRSVILNPRLNYGAPTVVPCGYTVATLLRAVESEGGIRKAADACGINPIDVELAIEYEKNLAA